MSSRTILTALLLSTGLLASACTAILPPDESDDGVERCDNNDDCEKPDDNRFDTACVYGDGQDESSQKVCALVWADVNCSEEGWVEGDPVADAFTAAVNGGYAGCEENPGALGCLDTNGCEDGLEPNALGVCDDPDASLPAVVDNFDNRGQDVRDQICRHRFCDDRFVCDVAGGSKCRECNESDPFGEGGCGELYWGADQISPIYISQDGDGCGSRLASDTDQFGEVP